MPFTVRASWLGRAAGGRQSMYESSVRKKSIATVFVTVLALSSFGFFTATDNVSAETQTTETSWEGYLPYDNDDPYDNTFRDLDQTLMNSASDEVAELGLVVNLLGIQEPTTGNDYYEVRLNALAYANTRQRFGYDAIYDDLDFPETLYYGGIEVVSNDDGVRIDLSGVATHVCFYGVWYNQLYVSSNGYVVMTNYVPDDDADVPPEWKTPLSALPSASAPNSVLAPFARDLNGGTIKWGNAAGYYGLTYFWIVWYEMSNQINSNKQTFALGFAPNSASRPICFVYETTTDDEMTIIGYEDQEGGRGASFSKSASSNAIRLDEIEENEYWLTGIKVSAIKHDSMARIGIDGWNSEYVGGVNIELYEGQPSDDGESLVGAIIPSMNLGVTALRLLAPVACATPVGQAALFYYGICTGGYALMQALSRTIPEEESEDQDAETHMNEAFSYRKTSDDIHRRVQMDVWDASLAPQIRWKLESGDTDPFADTHYLTIKANATYRDVQGSEHTVTTELELTLDSPNHDGVYEGAQWFARTVPDCHDYTFRWPYSTPVGDGYHIDSTGSTDSGYDMIGWDIMNTYTVNSYGQLRISGYFRQTGYDQGCYLSVYVFDASDLRTVVRSEPLLDSRDDMDWVYREHVIQGLDPGLTVRIGIGRPDTYSTDYSLGAEWGGVIVEDDGYWPASIDVTSPNGGESWQAGVGHYITWTSTNNPGDYVKIELYKGSTLDMIIDASYHNDGDYFWILPLDMTPANDYRVRITSTSLPSVYDYGGYFSVVNDAPPTVMVTSPNGGEVWEEDTEYTITWTSANEVGSDVRIELYQSATRVDTIAWQTPNDGMYSWTVPTFLDDANDYQVRIAGITSAASDYSDSDFTITCEPAITVTSPDGGESWTAGTTHVITWTSEGCGERDVMIELRYLTVVHTITQATQNDGSFSWMIPPDIPIMPSCRIWIHTTDASASDSSDEDFAISVSDFIEVTSPNGGEAWGLNTDQMITWTAPYAPGSEVRIELYRFTSFYRLIVPDTENDGSYSWAIGDDIPPDNNYKIRIIFSGMIDNSDDYFEMGWVPTITVWEPEDGELWYTSTAEMIAWFSENDPGTDVRIDLYLETTPVLTIVSSTPNDGLHPWAIPADIAAANEYRIKVSSTSSSASDFSDGYFTIELQPRITVTSPSSGESWEMGSTQTITWTSENDPGNDVRIELYRVGAPVMGIVASTPNDGSHSWTIPTSLTAATSYQIKISSTTTSTTGYSAPFSIVSPPPPIITITSPSSGESWEAGSTQTITWTSENNPGDLRIELYRLGVLVSTIIASTPDDGSHPWTLPSDLVPNTGYQIRITSLSTSYYGQSPPFTITSPPPVISVLSPNGGEVWWVGSSQTITWTSANNPGDNVKIELYRDATLVSTIVSSTLNDGSHPWTVPVSLISSDDHRIRIASTTTAASDFSDEFFEIRAPPTSTLVTVTSPNGNEKWYTGSTETVTWTSTLSPTTNVRIDLYMGSTYILTIALTTLNDGSHPWTIPSDMPVGYGYLVRVTSTYNWAGDYSDYDFGIFEPVPTITVTYPNGGEMLEAGTTQTITWTFGNNPGDDVKIELYQVSTLIRTITPSTPCDGSYPWTIPADLTTASDYRVKISSTTTSASDYSNTYFSITAVPIITVTAPNGGESYQAGTTQTVTWTSANNPGSLVNVELYKSSTLVHTMISGTSNDGSHSWYVYTSLVPGSDYRVKVSSTTTAASDYSDGYFTITGAPTITVTSPNGGEIWMLGTYHAITWTSANDPGSSVKIDLYKSSTLVLPITSSTANDGTYGWTIPTTLKKGEDYRVRITSTTLTTVYDYSNAYFTLAKTGGGGGGGGSPPSPKDSTVLSVDSEPSITVTSPNGGESWLIGAVHEITWDYVDIPGDYVNIELYRGSILHSTITSSTACDGSYLWAVPMDLTAADDYRVRISSTTTAASDSSDGYFAIAGAPTITVISPNGGETWFVGSYHSITWTSANNPGSYVKIELHKSSTLVLTISSSTANDGLYGWTIPSTLKKGEDYRVKISSTTTPAYDYSDSYFTLKRLSGGGGGSPSLEGEGVAVMEVYEIGGFPEMLQSSLVAVGLDSQPVVVIEDAVLGPLAESG